MTWTLFEYVIWSELHGTIYLFSYKFSSWRFDIDIVTVDRGEWHILQIVLYMIKLLLFITTLQRYSNIVNMVKIRWKKIENKIWIKKKCSYSLYGSEPFIVVCAWRLSLKKNVNIYLSFCWELFLTSTISIFNDWFITVPSVCGSITFGVNKGNNKITELRTILQRESQNS
jgi:hypothetical protein